MCQDCGCVVIDEFHIHTDDHDHNHHHNHDHNHHHDHHHGHHHDHHHGHHGHHHNTINIRESILLKNDRIAQKNRDYFKTKGIFTLNVLSSPGAGKTALLERTLKDLSNIYQVAAIVGDLATDNDAQRLRNAQVPVIQITTGSACHLEANMIAESVQNLDTDNLNLLIIENVGNLVCPAAYDLGESLRVVLFSVTEGEDKPLKYPIIFKSADLVLITKIDLAEAVEFDRETAINSIQKVAPGAKILEISTKKGTGLNMWYEYLYQHINQYEVVPVGFV